MRSPYKNSKQSALFGFTSTAMHENKMNPRVYQTVADFLCQRCVLKRLLCFLSQSYNVSLLEDWLRSRDLQAGGAVATLEPLIQAVKLLQAGKKTEADAEALVQTCTVLSSQQVALCFNVIYTELKRFWTVLTVFIYFFFSSDCEDPDSLHPPQ